MDTVHNSDERKPALPPKGGTDTNGERPDSNKKKLAWLLLLIPLVLIAIVWIWKQSEINKVKGVAAQQNTELKKRVAKEIVTINEENLRLLAKPFVWAVRTEMLQGNINQVNLYLNEMVKEKNFKNVMIADATGKIISSTNKKFEGQPFSSVSDNKYLNINNTVVDNSNDSLIIMASPIMGFNKKLGTLMITYIVQKPNF